MAAGRWADEDKLRWLVEFSSADMATFDAQRWRDVYHRIHAIAGETDVGLSPADHSPDRDDRRDIIESQVTLRQLFAGLVAGGPEELEIEGTLTMEVRGRRLALSFTGPLPDMLVHAAAVLI